MKATEDVKTKKKSVKTSGGEAGFSLIELVIAVLVLTVMLLGTLSVFTYAVQYNRGNNLRSQALSVLQQEAELFRSSKYTPAITDSILLGGVKATKNVAAADGTVFNVNITVDNDPAVSGIQTDEIKPSGAPVTLKEIKIAVTPQNAEAAWQRAVVTEAVIQRVQSN